MKTVKNQETQFSRDSRPRKEANATSITQFQVVAAEIEPFLCFRHPAVLWGAGPQRTGEYWESRGIMPSFLCTLHLTLMSPVKWRCLRSTFGAIAMRVIFNSVFGVHCARFCSPIYCWPLTAVQRGDTVVSWAHRCIWASVLPFKPNTFAGKLEEAKETKPSRPNVRHTLRVYQSFYMLVIWSQVWWWWRWVTLYVCCWDLIWFSTLRGIYTFYMLHYRGWFFLYPSCRGHQDTNMSVVSISCNILMFCVSVAASPLSCSPLHTSFGENIGAPRQ